MGYVLADNREFEKQHISLMITMNNMNVMNSMESVTNFGLTDF